MKKTIFQNRDDFNMIGPGLSIVAAAIVVFIALPVVFTVVYSFNPSAYFGFSLDRLSLRWYFNLFSLDYFRHAFVVSLGLAACVMPLATLFGMGAAYALARADFKGKALLNTLVLSPIVVPGIITGMALLSLFSIVGLDWSFGKLVIAMTICTVAYPIRTITANLHGLSPHVEEAAINMGAGRWTTFWRIVLPQIGPGILSGCIFIFTMVLEDVSIVIFLVDMHTNTLALEAMNYMRTMDDPTIAAMSTMLIVITLLLALLIEKFIGIGKFMSLD
ncbi:MAG: ABC transporter permease [Pseudomonadota bacterium]